MIDLTMLAYHAGYGTVGWITDMVVSSLVHGLIYGAVFRVMRGMPVWEAVLLAVLVVGGLVVWARQRYR